MITALSWKNIWRSKRRSFVVMGAIILGVWALIFMVAFYNSFGEAFIRSAVQYEHSHLQVQTESYIMNHEISDHLEDADMIINKIEEQASVAAYSDRLIVGGMIASPKNSLGVNTYGINPELEESTTKLRSQLVDGTYFEKVKRNPMLISQEMADKLKVKVRSKVVLTFQDIDLNITAASFRVEGIFDSKSPKINGSTVYVRQDDLARLSGVSEPHEIAILLNESDQIETLQTQLQSMTSDKVRSYKEVAPEFNLMEESSAMTQQILTFIIMLALLFGIVNTMLMAVLERTREIGMLKAIGMHRQQLFLMIMLETILLSIVSGPIGLGLGYGTIIWLGNRGLDMSAYADALKQYGSEAIFYPTLDSSYYLYLMGVVVLTGVIGSIYPAFKAINLNPLEAIRKH
ncbi:MAG: putative ABC transport system permease protein [Cyclobacteriaceae bacterium]|jgi:putative ABC transport system permease protein